MHNGDSPSLSLSLFEKRWPGRAPECLSSSGAEAILAAETGGGGVFRLSLESPLGGHLALPRGRSGSPSPLLRTGQAGWHLSCSDLGQSLSPCCTRRWSTHPRDTRDPPLPVPPRRPFKGCGLHSRLTAAAPLSLRSGWPLRVAAGSIQ